MLHHLMERSKAPPLQCPGNSAAASQQIRLGDTQRLAQNPMQCDPRPQGKSLQIFLALMHDIKNDGTILAKVSSGKLNPRSNVHS